MSAPGRTQGRVGRHRAGFKIFMVEQKFLFCFFCAPGKRGGEGKQSRAWGNFWNGGLLRSRGEESEGRGVRERALGNFGMEVLDLIREEGRWEEREGERVN